MLQIEARQQEVNELHALIFGIEEKKIAPKQNIRETSNSMIDDDDILLNKAFQSQNGDKIKRLLKGDFSDYQSQSEGDQALCNHLAFWFNNDSGRIDTLFRKSGLMRDKWDKKHYGTGQTYGQHTIEKAISATKETFHGFIQRKQESIKKTTDAVGVSQREIDQAAFDGQMGCSNLFIKLFQDKYRYDHAASCWYSWNRHFWKIEDIAQPLRDCDLLIEIFTSRMIELRQELKELLEVQKLKKDDPAVKKTNKIIGAINDQIYKLKGLHYRKQIIEFSAVGHGSLGTSGDDWDKKPWLLPCKNGVVDLRTGKLRPGRQDDMLKTFCPINYSDHAACPYFEKAVSEMFQGNKELILFVQRLFGIALIGEVVEHILIILFGAGRNGKDTILEAIHNPLGEMAGPVRAEMMLDTGQKRSAGAPNAEIMALRAKRIVWASETDEGRKLDSSTVKVLTGGGDISGRPPYGKREISFKPSHSMFLMTNAKPRANPDDYALWKRIHLIPFTVSFVDNPKEPHECKRDKDLPQKLESEAGGILRWLVQGCLDYQSQGINPPDVVTNATKEYQRAEDILNDFFDECCIIDSDLFVKCSSLYVEYKKWSDDNNIKPMSGVKFGRKIGKRFNSKPKKKDGRVFKIYDGIGLITTDLLGER